MAERTIFTVGGTVQSGGALYITRQADEDLLTLCRSGTFAYILTARQMGKSSLMYQTAERLADEGIRSATIDLNQLGVKLGAEAWYFGLIYELQKKLGLKTNVITWWQDRRHFGYTQRLTQFFEEVLPAEISTPVVVFIDEIDSTLSLDFTDDFFAVIRYLYNARAENPAFKRLTFVLIGVATPGDLITDPHRTPFNIGQAVHLTDFTYEEALPLADGLGLPTEKAWQVLKWVMKWTGGHPYLTQRLCRTIAEQFRSDWTEDEMDRAVATTFFGKMSEEDNNLQFMRDMLTKRAPDKLRVLAIYREIRLNRRPVRDEEQSPIMSHLKLSGVVKRENGKLQVRNPIYNTVFDRDWIKAHWPASWFATIPANVKIAALSLAFVIAVVLGIAANSLRQRAEEQTLQAEQQRAFALEQQKRAEAEGKLAQQNAEEAERQKAIALELQKRAEAEKSLAEQSAEEAQRQKAIAAESAQAALEQRRRAEAEKIKADSLRSIAELNRDEIQKKTYSANYNLAKLFEEKAGNALAEAFRINTPQDYQKAWLYTLAALNQDIHPDSLLPISLGRFLLPQTRLGAFPAALLYSSNVGSIHSIAFSPDGTKLASEAGGNTIHLWDVANGKEIAVLSGHSEPVLSVAFSPDGALLASGGLDHTVRLWNVASGKGILVLSGHEGAVNSVAFSPDGAKLASGSSDKSIRLWNVRNGYEITALYGHEKEVKYVAFNPVGTMLASGAADRGVVLWNVAHLEVFQSLPGHRSVINSLSFSPNGTLLASGSSDKSVLLWDAKSGRKLLTLSGRVDEVHSVAFSSDSKWVAAGSSDKSIHIWKVASGDEIAVLSGHQNAVTSLAFSPDGTRLASGSTDNTIRLWDFPTAERFAVLSAHSDVIHSVAFNADGTKLASGSWDGIIGIWNLASRKIIKHFSGNSGFIYSVAFSPDGAKLASGTGNKGLVVWDLASEKPVPISSGRGVASLSVAFSSDGTRLASGAGDNTVQLWDLSRGNKIMVLSGHSEPVLSVAFNPNGAKLASGSRDKSIRLWDTTNGNEIMSLNGHTNAVASVAFSPNNSKLASGSDDKTICLWEISSGKKIAVLSGHTEPVLSVAFSPDGRLLASGSQDKTVRLWEVASGKQIAVFSGHSDWAASVAFSPDGSILASGASDKTIRLYDLSQLRYYWMDGRKTTTVQKLFEASLSLLGFRLQGSNLAPVQGQLDSTERLLQPRPPGVDPVDWILQNLE